MYICICVCAYPSFSRVYALTDLIDTFPAIYYSSHALWMLPSFLPSFTRPLFIIYSFVCPVPLPISLSLSLLRWLQSWLIRHRTKCAWWTPPATSAPAWWSGSFAEGTQSTPPYRSKVSDSDYPSVSVIIYVCICSSSLCRGIRSWLQVYFPVSHFLRIFPIRCFEGHDDETRPNMLAVAPRASERASKQADNYPHRSYCPYLLLQASWDRWSVIRPLTRGSYRFSSPTCSTTKA